MPIVREDLKFYKSAIFNDTVNSGGAPSANLIVDAVSENIFPSVPNAERISGSTKYRKVYAKADADGQFTFYNGRFYIENPTVASEMVYVFPASSLIQRQTDLSGGERLYGCGWLNVTASLGASSIDVLCESPVVAQRIFATADAIRISNKLNIDDTNGTEEYRNVTGVTWSGSTATLTLDAPLDNAYSATAQATRVMSLMPLGDLKCAFTDFAVVSGGGAYNEVSNPLQFNNRGCTADTWTLTFTSSSVYSISGAVAGNVGSGNVTTGATPINASGGNKPYFILPATGFSGSFTTGDTITFKTVPAVAGIWFKRIVPPNTPAFTGNKFVFVLDGETD